VPLFPGRCRATAAAAPRGAVLRGWAAEQAGQAEQGQEQGQGQGQHDKGIPSPPPYRAWQWQGSMAGRQGSRQAAAGWRLGVHPWARADDWPTEVRVRRHARDRLPLLPPLDLHLGLLPGPGSAPLLPWVWPVGPSVLGCGPSTQGLADEV